jgi:hypothetical protein
MTLESELVYRSRVRQNFKVLGRGWREGEGLAI